VKEISESFNDPRFRDEVRQYVEFGKASDENFKDAMNDALQHTEIVQTQLQESVDLGIPFRSRLVETPATYANEQPKSLHQRINEDVRDRLSGNHPIPLSPPGLFQLPLHEIVANAGPPIFRLVSDIVQPRQVEYRNAPVPNRFNFGTVAQIIGGTGFAALGGALGRYYQGLPTHNPEEVKTIETGTPLYNQYEKPPTHIPRGYPRHYRPRPTVNSKYVGNYKFPIGAYNYVEYEKYARNNTLNSLS
jgi:hypothetical protein